MWQPSPGRPDQHEGKTVFDPIQPARLLQRIHDAFRDYAAATTNEAAIKAKEQLDRSPDCLLLQFLGCEIPFIQSALAAGVTFSEAESKWEEAKALAMRITPGVQGDLYSKIRSSGLYYHRESFLRSIGGGVEGENITDAMWVSNNRTCGEADALAINAINGLAKIGRLAIKEKPPASCKKRGPKPTYDPALDAKIRELRSRGNDTYEIARQVNQTQKYVEKSLDRTRDRPPRKRKQPTRSK